MNSSGSKGKKGGTRARALKNNLEPVSDKKTTPDKKIVRARPMGLVPAGLVPAGLVPAGLVPVPIHKAVNMVLAHDITEVRLDFKGPAFKKGHIVKEEDIEHLRRLGKENIYVLDLGPRMMHEDDAAYALAEALMGRGVRIEGEPREGKINIVAGRAGLLKINEAALTRFNMGGEVICATLHDNMLVKEGQKVAATRAIPLVIERKIVRKAARISRNAGGVIQVKPLRRPKAGIVITGGEVFSGRIKDSFAPVMRKKIEEYEGEVVGFAYAPDDEKVIETKLREFIGQGADLLIATGGMSVDPDDVTRFAIRKLGASRLVYGSPVLPGAMLLVAYIEAGEGRIIPVLGVPTCAMYSRITVLDLVLPRILAGEEIGRGELARLGHGGLCLHCPVCTYPTCPFGKY